MKKQELYTLLRGYLGHGPCHNDKLKNGRNLKWSTLYGRDARRRAEELEKVLEDAGVKDVRVWAVESRDTWSKTFVNIPGHYFA